MASTKKTYKVFLPYCPVPDLCSKGHAHLGRCYNHADAEKRLMNHLMHSPAHSLDEGSAKGVIEDTAGCIVEHDEEWDDVEEPPRQKQPLQQHQKRDNDRKRVRLTDGPAASTSSASSAPSSNSNMALVQQQLTDLRAGHSEQLRAAYSFVKVWPFAL